MIIDPQSVSFESILNKLIAYVQSKPQYLAWRDFYESGAGTTVLELLAGIGSYFTYQATANRRETYLNYAITLSAAIANAQNLGYSSYRGRNAIASGTLDINSDVFGDVGSGETPSIFIPKYSILGTYDEYDVLAYDPMETLITLTYPSSEIKMLIGTLGEEYITVPSTEPQIFRFVSTMSEDIRLYLQKSQTEELIELPWSYTMSPVASFVESKFYWVTSNSAGGIDVLYLNDPVEAQYTQYKYETGDLLKVVYVQPAEFVLDTSMLPTELYFGDDVIGTLEADTLTSYSVYSHSETVESIRVNAPMVHEVGRVIRGRDDYKKLLKSIILEKTGYVCSDTSATDVSPAVVSLSYALETGGTLSTAEKALVLNTLADYNPYGIALPTIQDPTEYDLTLSFILYLNQSYLSYSRTLIQNDVRTIIDSYQNKLGVTINDNFLREIEHEVEDLPYIKICRVTPLDITLPIALTYSEYLMIPNFYLYVGS